MESIKITNLLTFGCFSSIGSWILTSLGGWDNSLETLLIFIAIDYLTGILCALVWHKSRKSEDGTFESKASLKGLMRKGAILLIILIANKLDLQTCEDGYIRTAVILFFIANEGLSIVENFGIMGVPLPKAIKKAFNSLSKNE